MLRHRLLWSAGVGNIRHSCFLSQQFLQQRQTTRCHIQTAQGGIIRHIYIPPAVLRLGFIYVTPFHVIGGAVLKATVLGYTGCFVWFHGVCVCVCVCVCLVVAAVVAAVVAV